MLFQRFEDKGLSHYSYIIACEGIGEAVVVDPRRDVNVYLNFLDEKGLKLVGVLETHIHADFTSGAQELAGRAGCPIMVSAYDEGSPYVVSFPHEDLHDGDEIKLGKIKIKACHTPGHTPEHLSYLIYDGARSEEVPLIMLSGDFLFVGSLGRPDLFGEDAKIRLAKMLYQSVQEKLKDLPDGLEICPAHGAGSMCGAGMSGRPTSTLGYERMTNPYLKAGLSEEDFIHKILSTVPPFPPYYLRMKECNSMGNPFLASLPDQKILTAGEVSQRLEQGHNLVDPRSMDQFCEEHIPGSMNIPVGQNFSVWLSWAVPYETPTMLMGFEEKELEKLLPSFWRVGLDWVDGFFPRGLESWKAEGLTTWKTDVLTVEDLASWRDEKKDFHLIDVRSPREFNGGHLKGAKHFFAGYLPQEMKDLPQDGKPLVLLCESGYRSSVGASLLQKAGMHGVFHVRGGMAAWRRKYQGITS